MSFTHKWFAGLLASCLLFIMCMPQVNANTNETSPVSTEVLEQLIDPIMKEEMSKLHIPGAAVVITQGEHIIYSQGYGFADLEQQVPVKPESTLFRIGSLTKSFTATAAMQLVEEGKLSLHDDINTALKDYQVNGKQGPISLHHLLTHTAGLDELSYERDNREGLIPEWSTDAVRTYLKRQPTIFTPGSKFQYSNAGSGLVGSVVEQVSGLPLNDYMQQHLFQPLGMSSATLNLPQDRAKLAKSYVYTDNGHQEFPYAGIHFPGGGAANLTPNDFAPYMIAHLSSGNVNGKPLLKPETIKMMHAKQFSSHERMYGIGYGFFRSETVNGVPYLWANGGIDGFNSKMVLIPSKSIGIFITVNSGQGGMEMHGKVVDAIFQKLDLNTAPKTLAPFKDSGSMIKELEGRYELYLAAKHGWAKGLRLLGSIPYTVEAKDDQTLVVTGLFQNDGQQMLKKEFTQIDERFFQEVGGEEQLYFHKEQGTWTMTGPMNFSLERKASFESGTVLMALYIAPVILFMLILLLWIIRYAIQKWRKQSNHISGIVPIATLLQVIFFIAQFTYGNGEILYGYSLFYRLVATSMPLISSALAIYLLIRIFNGKEQDRWKAVNMVIAVLTIFYTAYLFYWNFLSIHFS
ncbi:serine hydrolase [Paenibacillus sp. GSMTC-2017]|nr:serine hydrolase [Paenibacillus sp. GSMTC-2017]